VVAKALLWLATFVGLALIGSGTAARLLGVVPLSDTAAPAGGALVATPIGASGPEAGPAAGGSASGPARRAGCRRRDAGASKDAGTERRPPPAVTDDGRVVLNVAGEHDLVRLPGIGTKRARAIVELRAQLGRFRRVEDLLRVRGIGPRSLRRLRPLVVLDPPAPKE
jgi:competence protein ComEA